MIKTIFESYRAGLFQRKHWLPNLIAGVTVGIIALPLAMAFAIAIGVKPEQGIYTAIVAGLLVSIFGGSPVQIAGPTGAFIVILSGITATYGVDGLQIATLMAGLMLIIMGFAKLGTAIKFIPAPVILGFTAGIAVAIWVGQLHFFFGLPAPVGSHFHIKLWSILQSLPGLNLNTTLLGLGSLFILLTVNKLPYLKRVPAPLVALLAISALQAKFNFTGVATIGSAFGGIHPGLPVLHLPAFTLDRVLELIGPAFSIAMLGSIESLLSAVVADSMSGTKHHSNRELIGQGLANICTPLFNGFAATGAIARTAANIRNGGNSPLAGVIHAITLVGVLLFLAPLASNVPLTVLAAILFVVAWNMSEAKHAIKLLRRAPTADGMILIVTFLTTIFVDLVVAVNVGVLLAVLHFIFKMTGSVSIKAQPTDQTNIQIYTINGPIFFGAVDAIKDSLLQTQQNTKLLILSFEWVPVMDMTGLQAIEDCIIALKKRNIQVVLSGLTPRFRAKIEKAGIVQQLADDGIVNSIEHAMQKNILLGYT